MGKQTSRSKKSHKLPEKLNLKRPILKHTVIKLPKVKDKGFPDRSVGKESVYNAGDPSSIPRLGRSTGEGIGYPLQYSWVSVVAQLVNNLPARREP